MDTRFLGNTGLRVSKLCLGTMTFGKNQFGFGDLDLPAVKEMVFAALDAGVNFIDTADIYAFGESEDLLGQALQGVRKDVVVATKVRFRMSDKPNEIGASRHHILNSVDASLRRLRTDYIDLYQIHIWDPVTPLEETLRTLDDLVRSGKVRYIGASNFAAWQLMKALWVSDKHGWVRFESLQPLYNLAFRDIIWLFAIWKRSWSRCAWTKNWRFCLGVPWPSATCRANTSATNGRPARESTVRWRNSCPPIGSGSTESSMF